MPKGKARRPVQNAPRPAAIAPFLPVPPKDENGKRERYEIGGSRMFWMSTSKAAKGAGSIPAVGRAMIAAQVRGEAEERRLREKNVRRIARMFDVPHSLTRV